MQQAATPPPRPAKAASVLAVEGASAAKVVEFLNGQRPAKVLHIYDSGGQDVFASLDKICKPSCIFTSNTSGFVIAEIAEKCSDARKKLFAGMHYSNPVPVMRMLEIIYTEETSQDCIDACYQLGEAQDKAISLVRDVPGTYGFILNRVFAAAAREARQLVDEGIAQGC